MTQLAPRPNSSESEQPSPPPKRRGFGWKGIVLGIVLGVIVSGFVGRLGGSREEESTPATPTEETAVPQQPSRAVTVVEIEPQAIAKTLEVVGTVAAADLISVSSQRTGLQITNLLVDEGDFVQAGQVLAQLNNDTLRAELLQAKAQETQAAARLAELAVGARPEEIARAEEQIAQAKAAIARAEADFDLAQQRLNRNQELLNSGAIAADTLDETRSRRDSAQASLNQNQASLREAEQRLLELQRGTRREVLLQAEAQLKQAEAQVNLVTTRLQETQILAPRSGKIIEKFAQVGDLTSSSEPLFSIVENGQLELQANIPETQLNQVQQGQTVSLTADSDPNLIFTGTIAEIIPTIDPQSRQATLKISLAADSNLKPGMLLRAEIMTDQNSGFAVPTAAVIPEDGETATLFVLNADNTVTAKAVELGELLNNDQVEILSGLQRGDRLILDGAAYVKDGDLVEVVAPIS